MDSTAEYTRTGALDGQSPYFQADSWDWPIGLAKDGHMIMGPYKGTDGSTWACADRDVCNGAFIDDVYVYVGSETFPYVVGCWGPGPAVNYAPTCSSSGCGGESDDSSTAPDDTTDDSGNDSNDSGSDSSSSTTDSAIQSLAATAVTATFVAASLF